MTQPLGPFRLVAIATGGAFAVSCVVGIVLGLALAQHKVFDPVVGAVAVDVVNNLAAPKRAADVFFHHKAVNQIDPALAIDDQVAIAQCSAPASPCRMRRTGYSALLSELTLLRARGCVSPELTRWPSDRPSANCAWFGDMGHAESLPQLQEV